MIHIPVAVIDGVLTPDSDPYLVPGALRIALSVAGCVVYQAGDVLPQADEAARLAEARTLALAVLKEKRLEEEYAGPVILLDGNSVRFPSTVKDETRLNSLAGLFGIDPAVQIPDWKISDGVYVTMTAPLLMQVKAAGFAHIASTFSTERIKAAEIEACQSAGAVQSWLDAKLTQGWPG